MKYTSILPVMAAGLFSVSVASLAADQMQDKIRDQDKLQTQDQLKTKDQDQLRTQDQLRDRDIYGHQLMSAEERVQFRQKMMSAKTKEEREQIRAEHHKTMQARAKAQGINLPDEPPANRGPGSGMGGGMGGGMGPGGGRK